MYVGLHGRRYDKCIEHYNKGGTTGRIHVFDGFCGTHKGSRMRVRFITEYAWQHHFVTNMFIRPTVCGWVCSLLH